MRAADRTIAQAERSQQRTGVALHALRGGGNLTIVGPAPGADVGAIADAVVTGVRVHSSGGPFGLPLLAVHRDQAKPLLAAIIERLSQTIAAPLPTDALRHRATAAGAPAEDEEDEDEAAAAGYAEGTGGG